MIPPLDQCSHLGIGHRARQHPETAIRVNPFDALSTKYLNRMLDAPGNSLRRLDNVVLDIDYTQAKGDVLAQLLKGFQLIVAPPRNSSTR